MEASSLTKRKVVAKRPNGEDSLKVKMNHQMSKTEDELFETSSLAYGGIWGKEPGKTVPMGSTDPFFGNTVKDVYLSRKHNTVPLEQEDHGKMGKTANSADGSKIKKREVKLHMEKRQYVLENIMHLHGKKPKDKLKKMKKGKPDTNPSEKALEIPADLRENRLKKTQHSVAADMHSVKISDLQANMTETCGKKPKNQHKKTEKGKPVTSPSENAFEMPADLGEKRSKINYWSIADNIETMKLSDVRPNMMDPCSKKPKNWLKKTEKGKPVTNPSEYAAEMPADLGEKRPKENQRSLSSNVQITETSDLQANRIDRCGENPEDHKKTEKEKLVTSPIENVEMPIDISKVGALFSDPQGHAEREPSGLNWASSIPSIPHGIIQSTNTVTIGQAWQASANFSAINPLKRRHDDRDIFDSPRFKKRRVWDLAEQFEALSI